MRGPSACTPIVDNLHLGHFDEIMMTNSQFSGNTYGKWALQAEGLKIPDRLDTPSCPFFVLDTHSESPAMMTCAATGDQCDPGWKVLIGKAVVEIPPIQRIEHFAFTEISSRKKV